MDTYPIPHGAVVADNKEDILSQFAEFLEAKKASEAEAAEANDDEIEVWNDKGFGARGRRSGFSDWLIANGFSTKPEETSSEDGDSAANNDTKGKTGTKRQSSGTQAVSTARKYFGTQQAAKK